MGLGIVEVGGICVDGWLSYVIPSDTSLCLCVHIRLRQESTISICDWKWSSRVPEVDGAACVERVDGGMLSEGNPAIVSICRGRVYMF